MVKVPKYRRFSDVKERLYRAYDHRIEVEVKKISGDSVAK
jgi:hypothetical protein